jgi:predicted O-methyltransferase YrrM
MSLQRMLDLMASLNFCSVRLFLRNRDLARTYFSRSLRSYDELMRFGLPSGNPVTFLDEQGWSRDQASTALQLPTELRDGGGTQIEELVYLAAVTRRLQPKKIFEIGTFTGRTTAIFVMNAPAGAEVITLDLPPSGEPLDATQYIETDLDLIQTRNVGSFARALGLGERFQQILCDSMCFDPQPHRCTVDLAFIDGAHSLLHVKNDTEKVAVMVTNRSLVFWHDYGGKGSFRPLSEYLENLGRQARIYRIPGTSLAWTTGAELRRVVGKA